MIQQQPFNITLQSLEKTAQQAYIEQWEYIPQSESGETIMEQNQPQEIIKLFLSHKACQLQIPAMPMAYQIASE